MATVVPGAQLRRGHHSGRAARHRELCTMCRKAVSINLLPLPRSGANAHGWNVRRSSPNDERVRLTDLIVTRGACFAFATRNAAAARTLSACRFRTSGRDTAHNASARYATAQLAGDDSSTCVAFDAAVREPARRPSPRCSVSKSQVASVAARPGQPLVQAACVSQPK